MSEEACWAKICSLEPVWRSQKVEFLDFDMMLLQLKYVVIPLMFCISPSKGKTKQYVTSYLYNQILSLFYISFPSSLNPICVEAVWRSGWRADTGPTWSTTPGGLWLTGTTYNPSQVSVVTLGQTPSPSITYQLQLRGTDSRKYFLNASIWPKPYLWTPMKPRKQSSVWRGPSPPRRTATPHSLEDQDDPLCLVSPATPSCRIYSFLENVQCTSHSYFLMNDILTFHSTASRKEVWIFNLDKFYLSDKYSLTDQLDFEFFMPLFFFLMAKIEIEWAYPISISEH